MSEDNEPGTASSGGHVRSLDGLRGLAAVIVLIRHTTNAVTMPLEQRRMLIEGPFSLLFNAPGAVQLFFVLSGYVLASSLNRNRNWIDWPQFYVKRIFRIYPPFIAAVCFAWFLGDLDDPIALGAIDGLTPWLARATHVSVTSSQLLKSLSFPGPAHGLLGVGWTLTIEMVFSLLLPLMFLFVRRVHWSALLALSLAILLYGSGTFLYSFHFCLGIIAFEERVRLGILVSRFPTALWTVVLGAGLFLFCAPALLGWTGQHLGILVVGYAPLNLLLVGSGCFFVLVAALFVPLVSRVLASRVAAYLGQISFSIYLLHGPILIFLGPLVVSAPSHWTNGIQLLALVAVSTLTLSALSYRFIERPAIWVGNEICARLARLVGTRSVRSELIDPS